MSLIKRTSTFITESISHFIGKLAEIKPWPTINSIVINTYIKKYKVDLTEVKEPLSSFKSMQEFFIRDLKDGVRPVSKESHFVAPADSVLREFGNIDERLQLENVKGKPYKIEELIQDDFLAKRFSKGSFFNFYLSPRHYHHVHSPCTGRVVSIKHIPGMLLPVNDWFFKKVPFLFTINERVIFEIESNLSKVLVIMVGAFNVGKIKVDAVKIPYTVKAGERLGTFMLGSSVVLLCENKVQCGIEAGSEVKYGEGMEKNMERRVLLGELESPQT